MDTKERIREYTKAWHRINPNYRRDYHRNNPHQQANWRANNPSYHKEYNEKHKERRKELARKYYQKNKELMKAKSKRWKESNRDKVRFGLQKRYANKINAENTLTEWQWETTLMGCGYRCVYCGEAWEEMEHFIPVSKGGGFTANNILPSCSSCNSKKSAKDPFAFITQLPPSVRM